MLTAVGPITGRRVLDAACSPGLYLGELLERGAKVTAFDASPVMVRLASQQAADRARIDQAALGEPLPYPDGAFDLLRSWQEVGGERKDMFMYSRLSTDPLPQLP